MTDPVIGSRYAVPVLEPEPIDWVSETRVRVGDTDYDLMESDDGTMTRLRLLKTRPMIEGYLPIIEEFRGANVVELGIYRGGSTALFAQVLAPRRLVALELEHERVAILDEFVQRHALDDVVRLHYGIDQSDQERVASIVEDELGGEPIDLVLDDASHQYGPTTSSFETLFPRLRPGGLYVIEDWRPHQDFLNLFIRSVPDRTSPMTVNLEATLAVALAKDEESGRLFLEWCARTILEPAAPGHAVVSAWYDAVRADPASPVHGVLTDRLDAQLAVASGRTSMVTASLTTFAAQLLIAVASGHPGLGELTVTPYWIALRRGTGPIDPAAFRIDALAVDHLGTLAAHDSPPAPVT
jgi:hypothetical protein